MAENIIPFVLSNFVFGCMIFGLQSQGKKRAKRIQEEEEVEEERQREQVEQQRKKEKRDRKEETNRRFDQQLNHKSDIRARRNKNAFLIFGSEPRSLTNTTTPTTQTHDIQPQTTQYPSHQNGQLLPMQNQQHQLQHQLQLQPQQRHQQHQQQLQQQHQQQHWKMGEFRSTCKSHFTRMNNISDRQQLIRHYFDFFGSLSSVKFDDASYNNKVVLDVNVSCDPAHYHDHIQNIIDTIKNETQANLAEEDDDTNQATFNEIEDLHDIYYYYLFEIKISKTYPSNLQDSDLYTYLEGDHVSGFITHILSTYVDKHIHTSVDIAWFKLTVLLSVLFLMLTYLCFPIISTTLYRGFANKQTYNEIVPYLQKRIKDNLSFVVYLQEGLNVAISDLENVRQHIPDIFGFHDIYIFAKHNNQDDLPILNCSILLNTYLCILYILSQLSTLVSDSELWKG